MFDEYEHTQTNDAVILLNSFGKIIEYNKAAELLFQWEKLNVKNRKFETLAKKKGFNIPTKLNLQELPPLEVINTPEYVRITDNESIENYSYSIVKLCPNKTKKKPSSDQCDIIITIKTSKKVCTSLNTSSDSDKIAYLEDIIAKMPNIVYWKDINGTYYGCNSEFAKIAGLSSHKDALGLSDFDMPWKEEAKHSYSRDDLEIIKSGIPKYNIDDTVTTAKGDRLQVITNKVPIRDKNGEVFAVLGIATDITERKKQEKELMEAKEKAVAATKAKSKFLAVISHELRTPLNGILGNSQILMTHTKEQEDIDKIQDIYQSCTHLLDLVNNILDYSKLEFGKLKLNKEPIVLNDFLNDVVTKTKPLCQNKQLELSLKVHSKLQHTVYGDPLRLRQILYNLIGNSVKFTKRGEIIVSVKHVSTGKKFVTYEFAVSDTGIGIPKDKLKDIFKTFEQVDFSYSRQYDGAGLGLSICRQLTKLMGGDIGADSKLNSGSHFWFRIPFERAQENAKISQSEPETNNTENKSKVSLKILLVEDNEINQRVAMHLIKSLNHDVDLVDNGKKAIKAYKENDYDIILMDLSLPGIDGFEATTQIRKLADNKKHTPIIAVSAHVFDSDKRACLDVGMDDFLMKPILLDSLEKVLRKWT